jgi:hypothetical protein
MGQLEADDVNYDSPTCRNRRRNRVEGMGKDKWETCNNKPTEKKVRWRRQWKVDHELGAGMKL